MRKGESKTEEIRVAQVMAVKRNYIELKYIYTRV